MRLFSHQLLCLAVCLVAMVSFGTTASAVLKQNITNTANLNYTAAPATLTASVDVYATIATANSATIKITAPATVALGSTSPLSIKISNTGINDLLNGTVTLTPPVGTTLSFTADPYGKYVATPHPTIVDAWSVTVPDVLVGNTYTFPASLIVPNTATPGSVTVKAGYLANGVNIVTSTAPVQVQNTRTPAEISFLHFNATTQKFLPAEVYHAGQRIYVQVIDGDQNISSTAKETVSVTLKDSASNDTEQVVLTETGVNTGVFVGSIASTRSSGTSPNNQVLSVNIDSTINATYTDKFDNTDTKAAAALVDPFGIVFDSASGVAIDGVSITVINVATGLPATVYGDDSVSIYPSTVVTGGSVTDASGAVYNFESGKYRFPFMNLGNYRFEVTTPAGYSFPSQVSSAVIQALPGAPYAIVDGSKGENFTIQAGPALNIDIPLDSKGVNLFVRKTTVTPSAAMGDRVSYQISVENVHVTSPSSNTIIHDTLPLGFRYQEGSAILDGQSIANPTIATNGRELSFNIGIVSALSTKNLSYTTVVGANAQLGLAVNQASASGSMGTTSVSSNTSKASVNIIEDLIRSRGFVVGTVFIDENMNEIHDEGEVGVQGIRIFMQDGRSIVTDKDGRYHFDGLNLGTHVLQMDKKTIEQRYQAVGLKQTRFSNNDYSQFVEITGGGLARANFRLINRAPDETPVEVKHTLSEGEGASEGLIWADVDVLHGDKVQLSELNAFYNLPAGWKYVEGSAMLGDQYAEPSVSPVGLQWKLDKDQASQHIRLTMRGGGEGELKKAIAYARFVSPGSAQGRTGLASINIQDTVKEQYDQRSFTLHMKFASRKAELPEKEVLKLNELIHSLNGLVVRELIVEGHTDSIPIARNHREEFADNMALSQARSDNIAAYLQTHLQLDEGVVQALGKGELEPLATNATAKGRERNRRVVLKIRADKISHDFSTNLQEKQAEGQGKALDSWDKPEVAVVEAKKVKDEGILSPVDGMSLPHPTTSVRLSLDSRLDVELKVDGRPISDDKIGFKSENPETGKTIYTYIGVDFGKQGTHTLSLKGVDTFGNARIEESMQVVRTGELVAIQLVESGENIADGKTPVRFKLNLTDNTGERISGNIKLAQLGGNLTVKQTAEVPLLAEEASQQVYVDADGWVSLAPVTTSGTHRITLGYNEVQETIEVYVKPELRDWILVGFGEGTIGFNNLSGAVQPISNPAEQDKLYKDGQVSFYAKGQVAGDFLLTLAYDTVNKNKDNQASKFGDIDPNSMYTIYGDTTQQQFDATSSKKLYIKIERDTFYALFGDYNTGLSTTELTRYSRAFTGVKAELHEDSLGFTAFATQTSQTMRRDEIRGNGTSGLYQLSRKSIIANTETILIETVDRFKSEVILDSVQLTRHVDYDIDYVLGTVWFKQPIMSKDSELNPVMIRIEYESDDLTDQFTTAGGRVYVKPNEKIEVGGTFISEGYLGGSNTLSGVDVKVKLNDQIQITSEVAESSNAQVSAQAWKVEALLAKDTLSGKAYARQQDDNFGLGQQLGSENSTLKVGADAQYRLDEDANVNGEVFHQEVSNTGAKRDMAAVQYNQRMEDYDVRTGVRRSQDTDGAGTLTSSTLGSVGATKQVTARLSVRADHEQALSSSNTVDFPTRSTLGAEYSLTETTSLTATQEWTKGQQQDTTSTRLGVNTQPWNGAMMTTSYEQQLGEGGKRSFANAGLLQTWEINQALSFSAGLDQTKVLNKGNPVQINPNSPITTGGEGFTAYSMGVDYHPGTWVWTNRLEYRTSDLSKHHGASIGVQGSPLDALAMQWTLRWQKDAMTAGGLRLQSDASLRAAWRPSYDQLVLLNRFDIRRDEQVGGVTDSRSLRYINNMTANWQTDAAWQLRLNHGIKLSDESIATSSWSGLTDLMGMQLIYDFNEDWDVTVQSAVLRVRHLSQTQPLAGFAVGYNMFDNFWLSSGYNFVGFYDQDFTAAEYSREGFYIRFRFKYDQDSLGDMLK
ncbi:MAG: OmpA family protein [Ghiorsea sp.]